MWIATAAVGVYAADLPNPDFTCPLVSQSPAETSPHTLSAHRGQPLKRAAACFLAPTEAKQKYLRGSTVLVDVRNAADFDLYRIPNSLNIPLHLLKTKPFLKANSVVLVNEGRSTAELEQTCTELRAAGFRDVTILEGGLNGWLAIGGELAGDVAGQRTLDRMTSEEMFVERGYTNWLVLDFTNGSRKDIYPWLPIRVERIKPAPANKPVETVRAAVARYAKTPGLQIVVVADTDADYARIEPIIAKAGIKRALYLAGGLQGYADSLNKQVAMWRQKDQPLRFPACRG